MQKINGIRTISPEEICPPVRVGVWVKVRLVLGLGAIFLWVIVLEPT